MLLLWRINSFETLALWGYVSHNRAYTVNMFANIFASFRRINSTVIQNHNHHNSSNPGPHSNLSSPGPHSNLSLPWQFDNGEIFSSSLNLGKITHLRDIHIPQMKDLGSSLLHFLLSLTHFIGLFLYTYKSNTIHIIELTKPTNDLCAQRRLSSAWASALSDQTLHCPHEETLGP